MDEGKNPAEKKRTPIRDGIIVAVAMIFIGGAVALIGSVFACPQMRSADVSLSQCNLRDYSTEAEFRQCIDRVKEKSGPFWCFEKYIRETVLSKIFSTAVARELNPPEECLAKSTPSEQWECVETHEARHARFPPQNTDGFRCFAEQDCHLVFGTDVSNKHFILFSSRGGEFQLLFGPTSDAGSEFAQGNVILSCSAPVPPNSTRVRVGFDGGLIDYGNPGGAGAYSKAVAGIDQLFTDQNGNNVSDLSYVISDARKISGIATVRLRSATTILNIRGGSEFVFGYRARSAWENRPVLHSFGPVCYKFLY